MKLFTICVTLCEVINICSSNNNYIFFDNKKIKELDPVIISSKLGSKILITIPNSRHENHKNIELINPNGETVKQKNITFSDKANRNTSKNIDEDKERLIENVLTTCSINFNNGCKGIGNQENLSKNQYCDFHDVLYEIGPLEAVDFGNWVLSKESTNEDGEIVETFKVISVEIIERKSLKPKLTTLNIGESYKLRFEEKIPKLETCELIAPDLTFDRHYERDLNNLDFCSYIINNVTLNDAGLWKIVAVGELVYEGYGMLEIGNKIL